MDSREEKGSEEKKEKALTLDEQMKALQCQIYEKPTGALNNLSMIQIERRNRELDEQVNHLENQYREDIADKTKIHEEKIKELKRRLKENEQTLAETEGRLNESRKGKEVVQDQLLSTRKEYEAKVANMQRCIDNCQRKLYDLEQEKARLKIDGEKMKKMLDSRDGLSHELDSAKTQLAVYESTVSESKMAIEKLEAEKRELQKSIQEYEAENEVLRKRLDEHLNECKEKLESEDSAHNMIKEELSQIQEECERLRAQLAAAKAKESEQANKIAKLDYDYALFRANARYDKNKVKDLESSVSLKDSQISELEGKISSLEAHEAQLHAQVRSLECDMESLRRDAESKSKDYVTLVSIKEGIVEQKEQLETEIATLKCQRNDLKLKADDFENLTDLLARKDELLKQKIHDIEKLNSKIGVLQGDRKDLMDALKQMDEMNDDAWKKAKLVESELNSLKEVQKISDADSARIREELRKAKIELNEAKSLKSFTEMRLQQTESTLLTQSKSKESEFQVMFEKLDVASKRNEELSSELSVLTTKNSVLESENLNLRKNMESVKSERDRLGKDSSQYVNIIVTLKEENIELTKGLRETLVKAESYKQKWETAQEQLSILEHTSRINELKWKTMNQQQKKVIDELVEQVENIPKKKKGTFFTPKRSENDGNDPRLGATPHGRNRVGLLAKHAKVHPETHVGVVQKELFATDCLAQTRDALLLEKAKLSEVKGLKQQGNFDTPLTKKTPTLPIPRKEENVLLKERSNTIAGTPGKVITGLPHDVHPTRSDSIKRCMACWEPIYKGNPVSECHSCGYVFHLACSLTAGDTCGLSEKKAYEIEKSSSSKRAEPINNEVDKDVRGVVKVRSEKMQSAENRLLIIENDKLKMYVSDADRKTARPSAMYPLNENTVVYFRIDKSENKSILKDEIAFAMKVTFCDEEGRSTYLYMFHKNKRQKRYWIQALVKWPKMSGASSPETTLSSDLSMSGDEDKENNSVKFTEKMFVNERSGSMHVNCAYYLAASRTYLLGCDDGLYSAKDITTSPVKIEGPSAIHDIAVLDSAKLGIFIEGPKQALTTVYSGLLKSCAEAAQCSNPKFRTQTVPMTKDCYMIATRGETFEETAVAVATSKTLLFCKIVSGELAVLRELDIEGMITSLLMTPHSVLYGSDNVREIDTKTFQDEEFLDMTDDAIYYMQIINESHGSYPVAILDVTRSRGVDAKESEYLICFQDIGIFVDGFGRRSRDGDVLWSHVPLAFQYRHPFLYIVHFTSVEVQKLDAKSYTKLSQDREKTKVNRPESKVNMPEIRFLPVNSRSSPSQVGQGARGVVVALHEAQAIKVMELSAS